MAEIMGHHGNSKWRMARLARESRLTGTPTSTPPKSRTRSIRRAGALAKYSRLSAIRRVLSPCERSPPGVERVEHVPRGDGRIVEPAVATIDQLLDRQVRDALLVQAPHVLRIDAVVAHAQERVEG